jgi:phosphatidylglycerophosphatase A
MANTIKAVRMDMNIFKHLQSYLKSKPKKSEKIPEAVWQDPLYFIAFGFGSGTIPIAPGTFGTLLAIPFYLLLRPLPVTYYITFVVLFAIFSMWLCDRISRTIKIDDHPGMCIDEFVGFFVTMIAAPPGWQWILLGFVLFRLFDILKPWPISLADKKIKGGFGMVLDDIIAGVFSLVLIQICARVLT